MTTTLDSLANLLLQWGPHHPTGPNQPMGPHWGGGMGSWAGGTGSAGSLAPAWALLTTLLVAVAVVAGAYLLLRAVRTERAATGDDEALAVLRGRYARGEIDDDEYQSRRRTLGGDA